MAERPIHRRDFFREGLRGLVRTVAESVEGSLAETRAPALLRRLRPPGALAEGAFLSACTRCDDCVQVCPAQCITHVPEGHPDAGTPVIVPSTRACVLCSDLACTHVCEPGALLPLGSPGAVAIGLAWVDPGQCVAFHGEGCRVCLEICPTEPRAIELDGGRPRVRAELCTGCGLCEERCPTRPKAIQVHPPGTPDPFASAGPGGPI